MTEEKRNKSNPRRNKIECSRQRKANCYSTSWRIRNRKKINKKRTRLLTQQGGNGGEDKEQKRTYSEERKKMKKETREKIQNEMKTKQTIGNEL